MTVTSSRRSPPPRRSSATRSVCETRTARCARRRWTIVLLVARACRPLRLPGGVLATATRASSSKRRHCRRPRRGARATWTPRRRSAWSASPIPAPPPTRDFSRSSASGTPWVANSTWPTRPTACTASPSSPASASTTATSTPPPCSPTPAPRDAAAAALVPFSGADASAAPVGAPQGGGAEAGVKISCRKCRRLLARGANALPHQPGEGLDAFSWRRRAKTARAAGESAVSSTCQNVFLQPLAWMRGVEDGGVEGKLCCPRCDVKVGHFNWSGCQCSCGAWVTPAFYAEREGGRHAAFRARRGTTVGRGDRRSSRGIRAPRFAVRPPVRRPSAGGGGKDGRRRGRRRCVDDGDVVGTGRNTS